MFLSEYEVLANSIFEKDGIFGEFRKDKGGQNRKRRRKQKGKELESYFHRVFSAPSSS